MSLVYLRQSCPGQGLLQQRQGQKQPSPSTTPTTLTSILAPAPVHRHRLANPGQLLRRSAHLQPQARSHGNVRRGVCCRSCRLPCGLRVAKQREHMRSAAGLGAEGEVGRDRTPSPASHTAGCAQKSMPGTAEKVGRNRGVASGVHMPRGKAGP